MPEGVDGGRRGVVAGKSVRVGDVFVAKGDAEAADDGARDARNDGEGNALLQCKSLGHEDEFTFLVPGSSRNRADARIAGG